MSSKGSYEIRPNIRFDSEAVQKDMIRILNDFFSTHDLYDASRSESWTRQVIELIAEYLQTRQDTVRYKFIIQVVVAEERGAGLNMTSRCSWDLDSDALATASFNNHSLVCVASLFAIYHY